ncbi:hypothetical protein DFH07DRAFT_783225 [Mycena maculata]|uniref:Uncharacterized protein n=1 Tax=Mycena maculata TaxID=230809 RepID=A0AAD7HPJ6_9AGAR|nr:hypothetical protein DFH07DRAFT_783225 [Mycena maculata]
MTSCSAFKAGLVPEAISALIYIPAPLLLKLQLQACQVKISMLEGAPRGVRFSYRTHYQQHVLEGTFHIGKASGMGTKSIKYQSYSLLRYKETSQGVVQVLKPANTDDGYVTRGVLTNILDKASSRRVLNLQESLAFVHCLGKFKPQGTRLKVLHSKQESVRLSKNSRATETTEMDALFWPETGRKSGCFWDQLRGNKEPQSKRSH